MTTPIGPPNGSPSFTPRCANAWRSLSDPESLNAWLSATSPSLIARCLEALRPREEHQLPPAEPWSAWLFLGGRGAGKTFAGAAWAIEQALAGRRLALVGPTFHDVREVMIEGPSGLRALSPSDRRPRWETSRRRLVWPNGATAYAFSAEDPDSLRGPQFHAAWADEF